MKKRFFFLVGLLLFGIWARGQKLVGAAGGTINGSTMTVEWAVSELAIMTIQPSGSSPVLQGLLQPWNVFPFVIIDANEPFDTQFGFKCYPNPTSESFTVETSFADFVGYRVVGFDGKIIEEGHFDYSPISVSQWPSGVFVIQLTSNDQSISKTFKIVKP